MSGCPACRESLGEKKIRKILQKDGVIFQSQKTFKKCVGKSNHRLKFDFYVKNFNLLIEYDGIQHYKYIPEYHKSIEDFEYSKEKDKRKTEFCLENNIILLRFTYKDSDEFILEKLVEILSSNNYIINY